MDESNHLNDEPKDLDLSSLPFDKFAAFFFAREVVPDDEQYDYFLTDLRGEKYFEAVPSSPEVLVNHLTKKVTAFDLDDSRSRALVLEAGYRYITAPNAAPEDRELAAATFNFPMAAGFLCRIEIALNLTGRTAISHGAIEID
jgi:hypothetical protein